MKREKEKEKNNEVHINTFYKQSKRKKEIALKNSKQLKKTIFKPYCGKSI